MNSEQERILLRTISELTQAVVERDARLEALREHAKVLEAELAQVHHRLEQLLKRQYGRSSERLSADQRQANGLNSAPAGHDDSDEQVSDAAQEPTTALAPTGTEPGSADGQAACTGSRNRNRDKHGRSPIPKNLERVEVIVEVPEDERTCPVTGLPMVVIGYEESEKFAYHPARLYVIVYKRPKLVSPLRHNGYTGVYTPPMPDFPIARCKADVSLLAAIIVAKFADHLPLYRQEVIFAREEVYIPDTTMNGWLMALGRELLPVLEPAFKQALFEDDYLCSDDTPVDLIEPGRGSVRQARLWLYLRHRDPQPPGTRPQLQDPPRRPFTVRPRLVVYDFAVDRCKERPAEFLGAWRGDLQVDAYSGYNMTLSQEGMNEVGCWTHARRGFSDSLTSRPIEATEIITLIGGLYKVEDQVRGCDPATRLAARQAQSVPVLNRIYQRMDELVGGFLPAEPIAKACGYLANQRDALWRYTTDGRLEIDNNTIENWARPVAVGRNNWLFMGSEKGGKVNAMFLSLVQSCRCNDINPWRYLCDLFTRIMPHPANRVRELLPDVWKPLPANSS